MHQYVSRRHYPPAKVRVQQLVPQQSLPPVQEPDAPPVVPARRKKGTKKSAKKKGKKVNSSQKSEARGTVVTSSKAQQQTFPCQETLSQPLNTDVDGVNIPESFLQSHPNPKIPCAALYGVTCIDVSRHSWLSPGDIELLLVSCSSSMRCLSLAGCHIEDRHVTALALCSRWVRIHMRCEI